MRMDRVVPQHANKGKQSNCPLAPESAGLYISKHLIAWIHPCFNSQGVPDLHILLLYKSDGARHYLSERKRNSWSEKHMHPYCDQRPRFLGFPHPLGKDSSVPRHIHSFVCYESHGRSNIWVLLFPHFPVLHGMDERELPCQKKGCAGPLIQRSNVLISFKEFCNCNLT